MKITLPLDYRIYKFISIVVFVAHIGVRWYRSEQ